MTNTQNYFIIQGISWRSRKTKIFQILRRNSLELGANQIQGLTFEREDKEMSFGLSLRKSDFDTFYRLHKTVLF